MNQEDMMEIVVIAIGRISISNIANKQDLIPFQLTPIKKILLLNIQTLSIQRTYPFGSIQ